MKRKSLQAVFATAALVAGSTSALATIVAVAPDAVLFVPADVRLDQTESNVRIIAFDEKQCRTLPADLHTGQSMIGAGTKISSHLLHMDPVNAAVVLDGKARFDAQILGVISSSSLLDDSDFLRRPGVIYPMPGAELNSGLEAFQPNDRYQIIQAGQAIHVQMDVPSFSDQVRVITCCEESGPGHDD